MAPNTTQAQEYDVRQTARSLVLRCIYAIAILGILAVSNYLMIQIQVQESQAVVTTINLSGRQQSLILEAARGARKLTESLELRRRQEVRRKLEQQIAQLNRDQRVLVSGSEELGVPAPSSPHVRWILQDEPLQLERHLESFHGHLRRILAASADQPLPADHASLLAIEEMLEAGTLQEGLTLLASYFRNEGEAKIYRVDMLNRWYLASMLAVMLFLAVLVFLPMIRRIRLVMQNLTSLNQSLENRVEDRTRALIARAHELEHSNDALRELRTAMENAVEGIARLDTEQRYSSSNSAYAEMFGLATADLQGKSWEEWILQQDRPLVAEGLQETQEVGKCDLEVRGRHQNGETFHLQIVFVKALDKRTSFDGFHVFAKDISARKVVEEALRESEERFRQLAGHIQQVLWLSEPQEERIIYVSPAFEEVFGRSCESLYARSGVWDEAIHPEDRGRVIKARRTKQLSGRYDEEYRIEQPNGQVRWIRDRAFPIRGEDGEILRIAGIAEDVTQARELQQHLLLSQRSFENLIMNCDVAMVVTDSQGRVMFINPAAQSLLGDNHDLLNELSNLAHMEEERNEMPILDKSGTQTGVAEISLIRTEWDGKVAHLLILHDITDRKLAEAELHAYANELKRSNKELEDFAFVASHDLQEPLRKIKSFGDRLIKKYSHELGSDGTMYLERMQNAAERMNDLITDLLTYSRVTTKGQPFQQVNLNEIVRDVLSDLEVRIEQTRGTVDVGELPTIDADATQMRQLFQNLIGNALKFRRDGVAPVVKVYGEFCLERLIGVHETQMEMDEICKLVVEDNGIGFDEKYLDRIFEVFQRLHGRGKYEGTGTGLAVCRKIVQRHGGLITATSTPGEGTVFSVKLPIRQPERAESDAEDSES